MASTDSATITSSSGVNWTTVSRTSLLGCRNKFAHDLDQLNDDLAHARAGAHGAERIYIEAYFQQKKQLLQNEFDHRRGELEDRWQTQREQLRHDYELAREAYLAPPVVVRHDPPYHHQGNEGPDGHNVQQVPPALAYLHLVLHLLN